MAVRASDTRVAQAVQVAVPAEEAEAFLQTVAQEPWGKVSMALELLEVVAEETVVAAVALEVPLYLPKTPEPE